jgi:phosphoglycerate dehydrogenase-like enzyme
MNILFAAAENAWGGFLGLLRAELPQHHFKATGRFSIDTLKDFDILIPTMSLVSRELLETGNKLRLIQQCGAGLETVDIEAARKFNIQVANVPTDISGNADSVAELGIYMMIGLSRDVRKMSKSLTEQRMGQPQGKALKGRTVGLIGLGGIGAALAKRLKAFDVHLIGIKRSNHKEAMETLGMDWVGGIEDLKQLLSRSDFVMLCLPLTSESRGLMDHRAFSFMKKDAFLINLSRGGIVDRDALEDALASGKIAGAGLDVFWEEPPDPNDPIFTYNVMATPHIAGSTDVSLTGIVMVVAENIRRLEKNLKPLYLN